jgi:nucleotide-binding universal stress UspA family protein
MVRPRDRSSGEAAGPAGAGVATIAVGYDGSPDAAAALRWAAAVAASTGAEVRVVHAVGLLEHAGLAEGPARDAADAIVADSGIGEHRVQWLRVDGEPASVLVRQAEEGADLLVVGTRGFWGHPGVLGSTSLELAERAPVPVVIVPRGDGGA